MSMPLLDPVLLQAFVAVADSLSFTRAASSLNRTQPAVSMQIKRLEERLGLELFRRTKTHVELSEAGEFLLGYARHILRLNEEAVGGLSKRKADGCIRIGVMDDYGTYVLPSMLAGFSEVHPEIRVRMEIGLTSTMASRLGEDLDLAIIMHPEGKGDGAFLRREQAVWAAGPSHSMNEGETLSLALYPSGCLLRQWGEEALDRSRQPWRLAFVSHSLEAVMSVAAQGLALTIVKSGVFPTRLKRLSESDGLPSLPNADIHLHRARKLSRPAALLADHLGSAFLRAA